MRGLGEDWAVVFGPRWSLEHAPLRPHNGLTAHVRVEREASGPIFGVLLLALLAAASLLRGRGRHAALVVSSE